MFVFFVNDLPHVKSQNKYYIQISLIHTYGRVLVGTGLLEKSTFKVIT